MPQRQNSKQRHGATMVMVAILLPVLFALAGIAVNFAYIQVVDTKVKIVTDTAVRAAGREFVNTGDKDLALAAAQQMAQLNPLDGIVVPITASDLEYGRSVRPGVGMRYTFEVGEENGNAVRLTTNSLANGSGTAAKPFFPIFGTNFEIRPVHSSVNTQSNMDVALVVDRSGSMAMPAAAGERPIWTEQQGMVPENSRWLDLVDAVDIFFSELNASSATEQVSLVSYANSATEDTLLSTDYAPISIAMDAFSSAFTGGGTNIEDGILKGIASVANPNVGRPWAVQAIVLMSDGVVTRGGDPMIVAQQAADQSIPIYTVSFSEGADQDLMRNIATLTGGRHFHADTSQQLTEAFRSIAQSIPSLLTK